MMPPPAAPGISADMFRLFYARPAYSPRNLWPPKLQEQKSHPILQMYLSLERDLIESIDNFVRALRQ